MEDTGLLQDGALLDAEEGRVVLFLVAVVVLLHDERLRHGRCTGGEMGARGGRSESAARGRDAPGGRRRWSATVRGLPRAVISRDWEEEKRIGEGEEEMLTGVDRQPAWTMDLNLEDGEGEGRVRQAYVFAFDSIQLWSPDVFFFFFFE